MAKKSKATKFYTVSGFIRDRGCMSALTCSDLFPNRKKVAEYIAGEINKYIEEENSQNPDGQMDLVTPEWCRDGYRLTEIPDLEVCYAVTLHKMEPVHAVVTFDQDDRTLNITTFNSKDAAEKRVAECAKTYVKLANIDSLHANREGLCEIDNDGIKEKEEYIHAETIGGNFTAWTAVEIPVLGKADIEVQ